MSTLYEVCGNCRNLYPTTVMATINVRDENDLLMPVRVCNRCASQQLTYIQRLPKFAQLDVRELLHLSITVTLALIAILVGAIIGHTLGIFLALTGVLSGAASLAVLAVKRTTT